ncbi:MAG: serine/threonine protein kinase, partial [Planctomycetes bacterium]|nr:serine/threonine protein kinase [Planctomycetota bacterium]
MQIGEYYVLGELGRGGMAVVYHARSQRTGTDVALKLLPPGRSPKQRERFRREAEALTRLHHPHVVGVHGVGEHQGALYMAMEFVSGEGLDERLERLGPLPVGYAVELFVPLARALGHAHDHGILHRDLKPSNVLISAAGTPYLADFGLAKEVGSQSGGADLTQEGALVGTPGFWSPEQARGDRAAVGPATDVYGLGATLYAALTGEAPCKGENLPELVIAVQDRRPIPPSTLRPEVPRALSEVCMRCLEKDPARRYPNAGALGKALAASLNATPRGAG